MAFEVRALTGAMVGGRYLVGELAGERDIATQFRGEDMRMGGVVDIHVTRVGLDARSHAAKALELEAMTACDIRHPNVLTPRDVGILDDGSPFVVTMHQTGETLEERVYGSGALAVEDVVRMGLELLSALAAAHELDIMHGDLRPESVFLVERDGLVLQSLLSGFGRTVGASVSIKTDLQALGELLYFAVMGFPSWSAPTGFRPSIPGRVLQVIQRAIDSGPGDRFASAREMLHALDAARGGVSDEPPSVRVTPMRMHGGVRPSYGLGGNDQTRDGRLRAARLGA